MTQILKYIKKTLKKEVKCAICLYAVPINETVEVGRFNLCRYCSDYLKSKYPDSWKKMVMALIL